MQDKLSRMKAMMAYGLQTENKNCQYCSVEQSKVAADGKMYGVVREGAKYYVKVSEKTQNPLKEDFDYIGGFRNRKNHEYDSCAKAMKQLELKLMSINEAYDKHNGIIIESWNPNKKEQLTVESTEKMRKEIARQREIMGNAKQIQENKGSYCKVNGECGATQKNNIKKTSDGKGKPVGNGGDPYVEKVDAEQGQTQKNNVKNEFKPVMNEAEEVLGWNDDQDYMDTTHGTEIGDSAPFDETTVVEECDTLHNCEDQNTPEVGTNEIGDDDPFIEEEVSDELILDDEDFESEEEEEIVDFEDEDADGDEEVEDFKDEDADGEEEVEDFEDEEVEEVEDFENEEVKDEITIEGDTFEERLASIEELIAKIANKLHIDEFENDELYPEDENEPEEDSEEEFEFEIEDDVEPFTEGKQFDAIKGSLKHGWDKAKKGAKQAYEWAKEQNRKAMEAPNPLDADAYEEYYDNQEKEDVKVVESKSFKRMMKENENKLNMFGKHPAYQKEVMTLPSNQDEVNDGYYDMNDESVENEHPYGQYIGDSAPFDITPEQIDNAIAESINRIFGKRKNL